MKDENQKTDIAQYRKQLDEIDEQICRLYEQRMQVAEEIAGIKMTSGQSVLDKKREQETIARLQGLVLREEFRPGARELSELLMAVSRKRQYQLLTKAGLRQQQAFAPVRELLEPGMKVVYQGAEGSYSEAAMKTFFGKDVDCFHVEAFRDAMIALEDGSAAYAVLPIENSTAGSVSQIYDLLAEFENYIVGEQIIRIEHCLMAPEGADFDTIRRVYSHPQSLMQSAKFLDAHRGWEQISMLNNAFAARKVAEERDVSQAAIASEYAAQTYGLKILKKGVNHSDSNSTRFIIVSPRKIYQENAKSVSLCLELPDEAGALYHILSHFVFNGLNMTRIESRPLEGRNWEYRFFIDFEGNLNDPAVRSALRGIREEASRMRILGTC